MKDTPRWKFGSVFGIMDSRNSFNDSIGLKCRKYIKNGGANSARCIERQKSDFL